MIIDFAFSEQRWLFKFIHNLLITKFIDNKICIIPSLYHANWHNMKNIGLFSVSEQAASKMML